MNLAIYILFNNKFLITIILIATTTLFNMEWIGFTLSTQFILILFFINLFYKSWFERIHVIMNVFSVPIIQFIFNLNLYLSRLNHQFCTFSYVYSWVKMQILWIWKLIFESLWSNRLTKWIGYLKSVFKNFAVFGFVWFLGIVLNFPKFCLWL